MTEKSNDVPKGGQEGDRPPPDKSWVEMESIKGSGHDKTQYITKLERGDKPKSTED